MFSPPDIAVDLGTSKIAAFVRGEGLVFEEPAYIAFRQNVRGTTETIAVGHEAAQMCGRTPPRTTVVKPIQDGVINDSRAAGLLLQALLHKHNTGGQAARRRFLVGSLFGANSMELRAFERVAQSIGARKIKLVSEPLAAAVGAELPIDEPRANMVVDVGGGATEAIVVSMKRIVSGGSVRIGGDSMNQAVIKLLRRTYGIDVSLEEAKRLKESVGAADNVAGALEVRGFDIRLRRPSLVAVRIADLQGALNSSISSIAEMVKRVVDGLPAELAADLLDSGITLTGGAAGTLGLRQRIEDAIQVDVTVLIDPQQAVIKGCGRMLEYYDYFA
jgi:rod shape-determining protein MreB